MGLEVVSEAASGIEAINIIDDVNPDIVFVDICMPFMNGIEFTKMATSRYPDLFVIVLTGFDDFEAMAAYDYNSEENEETTKNAYMLKGIMMKAGFLPSTSEWWHFRDSDIYPVAESFEPF